MSASRSESETRVAEADERFYAYRVTEVWGTQEGKTVPGQHLLEREYKGNGSYTWCVYDFGKKDMPLSASITGVYVGQVHGTNGELDDESKALLDRSRLAALSPFPPTPDKGGT